MKLVKRWMGRQTQSHLHALPVTTQQYLQILYVLSSVFKNTNTGIHILIKKKIPT